MKKTFFLIFFSIRLMLMATINWQNYQTLSLGPSDATSPQVVMDVNGQITVIWVQNNSIHAMIGSWNSWGPDTVISTGTSSSPRLAVRTNTGKVTALWIDAGFVTVREYSGGAWSAAVSLSATSGATSPSLAIDSLGNLAAAWVESSSIKVRRKTPSGSWVTVSTLGNATADQPQVGVGNGQVVVVWHEINSGIEEIKSARATSIPAAFGSQLRISIGRYNSAYPQVSVNNNGNALACWFQFDKAGTVYRNVALYSAYCLSGGSWSNANFVDYYVAASNVNPSTLISRIGLDEYGNGVVIWTVCSVGSQYDLRLAKWNFIDLYSESISLIVSNLFSISSDLGISYTGYTAVVEMYFNTQYILALARETTILNNANVFTPEFQISNSSLNSGYPQVHVVDDGTTVRAVAAWIAFNNSYNEIQISYGTDAMIPSPTISSIVQNNTSYGIYTNYYNTITWSAVPGVTGYYVYRNGIQISQVSSATTTYVDNNQLTGVSGTVTYGVAAVGNDNFQSLITSSTFVPP